MYYLPFICIPAITVSRDRISRSIFDMLTHRYPVFTEDQKKQGWVIGKLDGIETTWYERRFKDTPCVRLAIMNSEHSCFPISTIEQGMRKLRLEHITTFLLLSAALVENNYMSAAMPCWVPMSLINRQKKLLLKRILSFFDHLYLLTDTGAMKLFSIHYSLLSKTGIISVIPLCNSIMKSGSLVTIPWFPFLLHHQQRNTAAALFHMTFNAPRTSFKIYTILQQIFDPVYICKQFEKKITAKQLLNHVLQAHKLLLAAGAQKTSEIPFQCSIPELLHSTLSYTFPKIWKTPVSPWELGNTEDLLLRFENTGSPPK